MESQHEIGVEAYEELYGRTPRKKVLVEYSGRFKGYGANVSSTPSTIRFRLSKEYLMVGDEIRIGVIQHLLCKLHKSKRTTLNMELYDTFLKKIGEYSTGAGGEVEDDELQESFERVNQAYFDGYLLPPHIKWGRESKARLGYYSFSDDTITLSTVLRGAGDVLDYVMYHELLHKKHKYESRNGRTHSHTAAFKKDEKRFRTSSGRNPEQELKDWLRRRGKKGIIQRLLEGF